MEAGKRRLAGDTARAAATDEEGSAPQANALRAYVADLTFENRSAQKA